MSDASSPPSARTMLPPVATVLLESARKDVPRASPSSSSWASSASGSSSSAASSSSRASASWLSRAVAPEPPAWCSSRCFLACASCRMSSSSALLSSVLSKLAVRNSLDTASLAFRVESSTLIMRFVDCSSFACFSVSKFSFFRLPISREMPVLTASIALLSCACSLSFCSKTAFCRAMRASFSLCVCTTRASSTLACELICFSVSAADPSIEETAGSCVEPAGAAAARGPGGEGSRDVATAGRAARSGASSSAGTWGGGGCCTAGAERRAFSVGAGGGTVG
mmetsp:Transcript_24744/g.66126  ORF Transcript_24744/g.66126 Transcript_24744/m.66126 type:complete len:282 (-) Transcript_24744:287-1132(-)